MLVFYPSPLLRQKCEPYPESAKQKLKGKDGVYLWAQELLPHFLAVWQLRPDAVGIAAPQIGISLRVFIMDPERDTKKKKHGRPYLCINPVILESSEETQLGVEGCLSCPFKRILVKRPKWIIVRYTTELGKTVETKLEGMAARVFQHEYDHIEGVTIMDYFYEDPKKSTESLV